MPNNFSGNCDLVKKPSIKEKYYIHVPKQHALTHQLNTLEYLQQQITQVALTQDSVLHYGVIHQIFNVLHTLHNDLQSQLALTKNQSSPIHLMASRAARIEENLTEHERLELEEKELLDKLRTYQSIIEVIMNAIAEEKASLHLLTVEDILTEIHTMEVECRTELLYVRLEKAIH